jgi:TolB protein
MRDITPLGRWLALGLILLSTLVVAACGPGSTSSPGESSDPLVTAAVLAFREHARNEDWTFQDLSVIEVNRTETEATVRISAWITPETAGGEPEQQISTVRFVYQNGAWEQGQSLMVFYPPDVAAKTLDEADLPQFWYGLAVLDLRAERWALAADRFARVVSLDPGYRDAQAKFDELRGRLLPEAEILIVGRRDESYDLFVVDRDGQNAIDLTISPSEEWLATWAPDGQRFAFPSDRAGAWDIWVMNLESSRVISMTQDAANDAEVAWSPDGQWLLFTSDRVGNADLFLMPAPRADGTVESREAVNLTANPAAEGGGAWSPDGRWIVFASDRGEGDKRHLWLIPAPGPDGQPADAAAVQLTSGDHSEWMPAWSPDGQWIAYTTDENGRWDVYRLAAPVDGQPSTGAPENLTDTPQAHDWAPVWSPDSAYLAYASDRDGEIHVYRHALAPGEGELKVVRLTDVSEEEWPADWRQMP